MTTKSKIRNDNRKKLLERTPQQQLRDARGYLICAIEEIPEEISNPNYLKTCPPKKGLLESWKAYWRPIIDTRKMISNDREKGKQDVLKRVLSLFGHEKIQAHDEQGDKITDYNLTTAVAAGRRLTINLGTDEKDARKFLSTLLTGHPNLDNPFKQVAYQGYGVTGGSDETALAEELDFYPRTSTHGAEEGHETKGRMIGVSGGKDLLLGYRGLKADTQKFKAPGPWTLTFGMDLALGGKLGTLGPDGVTPVLSNGGNGTLLVVVTKDKNGQFHIVLGLEGTAPSVSAENARFGHTHSMIGNPEEFSPLYMTDGKNKGSSLPEDCGSLPKKYEGLSLDFSKNDVLHKFCSSDPAKSVNAKWVRAKSQFPFDQKPPRREPIQYALNQIEIMIRSIKTTEKNAEQRTKVLEELKKDIDEEEQKSAKIDKEYREKLRVLEEKIKVLNSAINSSTLIAEKNILTKKLADESKEKEQIEELYKKNRNDFNPVETLITNCINENKELLTLPEKKTLAELLQKLAIRQVVGRIYNFFFKKEAKDNLTQIAQVLSNCSKSL